MIEWPEIIRLAAIVGTGGSLVWWLSSQFSAVRSLVYSETGKLREAILDKLEYHERHDDTRFNLISNDLVAIKIRNASRDNLAKSLIDDIEALKK